MSAIITWAPLPADGRECPLLDMDQWGRVRSRALLQLMPAPDHTGIAACWITDRKAEPHAALAAAEYWQDLLRIEVPPRSRRARLEEVQTDPEVHRLLLLIDAGWTLARDDVFGARVGTLTPDARAALAALHVRVRALLRPGPRLPAPAGAQPVAEPA